MRLTGRLLDIEHYSGDFPDRETGEAVAYSGIRLHIWESDTRQTVKVKVPKDRDVDHMQVGDEVDVLVNVAANRGARDAYLTITYAGDVPAGPALSVASSY